MRIFCRECTNAYIDTLYPDDIEMFKSFGFTVWSRDVQGNLYLTCESCTAKLVESGTMTEILSDKDENKNNLQTVVKNQPIDIHINDKFFVFA